MHQPINVRRSGQPAHAVLPGVHRVTSLAKRRVLGTTRVPSPILTCRATSTSSPSRLDHRSSRSRGLVFCRMLELAVDHDPVRHRELVAPGGWLAGQEEPVQMDTPLPILSTSLVRCGYALEIDSSKR